MRRTILRVDQGLAWLVLAGLLLQFYIGLSALLVVLTIVQIRARQPQTHVLVLTTYDSDADILRAVEAGATGYLLKDASREDLFRAIRAAAKGESFLAPAVAIPLMGRFGRQ